MFNWFCFFGVQGLEKIITRDFFPDVSKLQAQKDYLEAEEHGDLEKMREIAIKYGSVSNRSTPRVNMPCKFQKRRAGLFTLSSTIGAGVVLKIDCLPEND